VDQVVGELKLDRQELGSLKNCMSPGRSGAEDN